MIRLKPKAAANGRVLLSYLREAFDGQGDPRWARAYSNRQECREIAAAFLEAGLAVDVIDWDDLCFIPERAYDFCIDIHHNLERLASLLPDRCKKIFHITGAHWLFQNRAELSRLAALQARRGINLRPRRQVEPSFAIERACQATCLGNAFTAETYGFAGRPIYRTPVSCLLRSEFPKRDYLEASRRFLWIGSWGLVHKGLDLVLEAFAETPELELTVCGPIRDESDFLEAYRHELCQMPNIRSLGWVNTGGLEFARILAEHAFVVFPSSSEGGGGSALTAMQGGLIPIVTPEASVDVGDFGRLLASPSPEAIREEARAMASLSGSELEERSRAAWEFARLHHSPENFRRTYRNFLRDQMNLSLPE